MSKVPQKLGDSDVRSGLFYEQLYGAFSENSASPLSRITQAKSAISLNPIAGCYFNCAYCYRHDSLRDTKITPPGAFFRIKKLSKL